MARPGFRALVAGGRMSQAAPLPTTAIRHQIEPDPAEMAAQRGDKATNGVSPHNQR
jgi:hypothetical protein